MIVYKFFQMNKWNGSQYIANLIVNKTNNNEIIKFYFIVNN